MTAPDVRVEIAFDSGWSTPEGSRTYTDVSDYVEFHEGIGIGVGRADELAVADANSLTLTLDNKDGRFTPGKTSSPYYPNVKIGRPIRVFHASVTANTNYITNPTFEVNTTGWVPGSATPPTLSTSTAQAWQGAQSLRIAWDTGGFLPHVQTTVTGLTIGQTYTVSAYAYIPTGSPTIAWFHGSSVTFGDATTVNDEWTRIRHTFVAEATSVPLQLWPTTSPILGDIAYLDGAMVNAGATAIGFNDSAAAESSRFTGYVTSWPTAWEGGSDAYANARVTASSRLARLGADAQLRSLIEEQILAVTPEAYYTLGEPEEATRASDSAGRSGGQSLQQTGSGAAVSFGDATGPGTDGLTAAVFAGGKYLRGTLGDPLGTGRQWTRCFFNTSTLPVTDSYLTDTSGDGSLHGPVLAFTSTGTIRGLIGHSSGTVVVESVDTFADGETHDAFLYGRTGATVLYVDGVAVDTDATAITLLSNIESVAVGGQAADTAATTFTGTISHAAFGDTAVTAAEVAAIAEAGLQGYAGDKPGKRLQRYATIAGIPLAEVDFDTGTPTLSHIDSTGQTPLDLMRKVEQTEGGVLFDAPDGTLTFQHRGRRYSAASQFTIAAASQYLEADYAPQHDDSTIINSVTATSGDGTVTAVAVDSASFDDYGPRNADLELFTTDEAEIHAAAWWRVNTYAEPVTRVPTLSVNLLVFSAAEQAAILALTVGSRITVTGLPTQAANSTEDYFVEGYTETTDEASYTITFNVSPAGPYLTTWVLDSATRSQLDTTTVLAY